MDIQAPAPAEPDAVHEITQETIRNDLSPQAWVNMHLGTFSARNLNRTANDVRKTNLPFSLIEIDSRERKQTVYLFPKGRDMEPLKRNSTVRKDRRQGRKRTGLLMMPKRPRATRSRHLSGNDDFSRAITSHIVRQACILISERYGIAGDSCSDDHATSGRRSLGVYLYSGAIALASLRHFLPWLYNREMNDLKELITCDFESRLTQSTTLQGQYFVHEIEMLIWAAYHDNYKYFDKDDRADIKKRLRYYQSRTDEHILSWEVKHSMKDYKFEAPQLPVDRRNRLESLVRRMEDLSTIYTDQAEKFQSVCDDIWDEIAGDFDLDRVHGLEFFFSRLAQLLNRICLSCSREEVSEHRENSN